MISAPLRASASVRARGDDEQERREGLPLDLWRDINRVAYAVAQASFAEHRSRFAAEALAMLKAGSKPAEVRAAVLAHERGK